MIQFSSEPAEEGLIGLVRDISFLGALVRYGVELQGGVKVQVDDPNPHRFRERGSEVYLILDKEAMHLQKGKQEITRSSSLGGGIKKNFSMNDGTPKPV